MTALREDLERYVGGRELPHAARGGRIASAARSARYRLRRRRVRVVAAGALLAGAAGAWAVSHWLFPPPAVPFDLRAYRYRSASNELRHAPAFDTVRRGDILGVSLDADGPQYVYALSVYGQRDPPTWVAAMQPELAGGATERPDGWGLLVPDGQQRVDCTRLETTSADVPYEGLWVFASAEPQPRLAEWLAELQRLASAGATGVPLARARELLLEGPPALRGSTVRVSAEERAAMANLCSTPAVANAADWPLEGVVRYVVAYRVEVE